jgi:hypothetical protein
MCCDWLVVRLDSGRQKKLMLAVAEDLSCDEKDKP